MNDINTDDMMGRRAWDAIVQARQEGLIRLLAAQRVMRRESIFLRHLLGPEEGGQVLSPRPAKTALGSGLVRMR